MSQSKKICFFDTQNKGHHWNYNLNVIKSKLNDKNRCIYCTKEISDKQKKILENYGVEVIEIESKQYKNFFYNNYKILKKVLMFSNNNKIDELYILYLDPYVIQLYILRSLFNKKIVATLHWYPNKKIKEHILQKLKEKIVVVVHTREILNKLENNARLVYYPDFSPQIEERKKVHFKKVNFLYFGALRLDKGIDILLESLKYCKNDFNLIIAGREATFKKELVYKKLEPFDKSRFIVDINYISDEKMNKYYDMSDVVILPYREHFSGESGILIDSLVKGKVIISTDISSAKEIISKYDNGEIFEFEDYRMLSKKIDKVIDNIIRYAHNAELAKEDLKEIHSLNNFIKQYSEI